MNYTLVAENTTKRHLRVELRTCLLLNNPHLWFYKEDRTATSRLHSIKVHDKRGKEIEIRRVRHGAWMIHAQKGTIVCINYILHAFAVSPTETYVSRDTWIINPKSSLMTIEGIDNIEPIVTLSSPSDTIFISQKKIQSDIEGFVVLYKSMEELYDTPILGGTGIKLHSIGSSNIVVKGEIDTIDITQICNMLMDIIEPKVLEQVITIIIYLTPGHIEKRALEYGEVHGSCTSFIILPTSKQIDYEIREKIIYSLYYHYYLKLSLSIEGILVPWFVEGFSYWNMIQKMKSIWSKEEYRLRIERCYIRTFSLEREINETVIDSGYNDTSSLSQDAGSVLCHQLNILFRLKDIQWDSVISTDINAVSSNKITNMIETYYSGDLIWLWSISLHTKHLLGWLDVCKKYITIDNWILESPKRGPLKILYE
jgi:hypothetical protein